MRDNIDLAHEYTDQQIWEVMDKVSLRDKFSTREGLETEIKDEGGNLSAGEKQLVCIARAILRVTFENFLYPQLQNCKFVEEQNYFDR